MRFISMSEVKAGMILAYDLLDVYGRPLLRAGSVLTDTNLIKLKEYYFSGIYVDDELSEGIVIEEAISPKLRQNALYALQEKDVDECLNIAKRIIEELMANKKLSLDLVDLRAYDEHIYAHSVNVAITSCVVGIGMNLKDEDLFHLVCAALIHDMGMLSVPKKILEKKGKLTEAERDQIRNHAYVSYQLIADKVDISAQVKFAVLSHHENVDGSGYPRGIVGDEQNLITKILHVADVYVELTAARAGMKPYSPADALEYIMGGSGMLFDSYAVECFSKSVSLYPKGTIVEVSDGRKGIVFDNAGERNRRPLLRMMDMTDLDLSAPENMSLSIRFNADEFEDPLKDNEMLKLGRGKKREKPVILAVDDVTTSLNTLRDILDGPYKLVLLKSGGQAINYIQKQGKPDLIIMDIDMPGMDGIATVQWIKAMEGLAEVPVMFVTAVHDISSVVRGREAGAESYIVKPFNAVFVRTEVDKILKRHGVI